jgi:hypothetical protein
VAAWRKNSERAAAGAAEGTDRLEVTSAAVIGEASRGDRRYRMPNKRAEEIQGMVAEMPGVKPGQVVEDLRRKFRCCLRLPCDFEEDRQIKGMYVASSRSRSRRGKDLGPGPDRRWRVRVMRAGTGSAGPSRK